MSENKIAVDIKVRDENDQYPKYIQSLKAYYNSVVNEGIQLFTTDSENLFDIFLDNLPLGARQLYTCNACKHFVNRYGGLVTIDKNGVITSALWNENIVPEFFENSVEAVKKAVLNSKVNGVFISNKRILGQPVTGEWSHMSVELPINMVYTQRLKTAEQMMAEKREDIKILASGLLEYSIEAIEQAVNLLKTEALYRSEKCLGVAEWFKDIHTRWSDTKNKNLKDNILWLAVGTAPVGFCHIKSSMIGTLLDDITAGMSFDLVSRRFADKMHPLQYQRPQAAPTAGNIAQAEKIVEKLGIQNSLVRRFARLDELVKIWIPQHKVDNNTKSGGVFSHLKAKEKKEQIQMNTPPITMTWKKFLETVLPSVKNIEFMIKTGTDNFSAILTASEIDAPPILQWDKEDKRNPFSWYVYIGGSTANRWNLKSGYCNVTGICYQPSMWYESYEHQGKSVFFILEGAKDTGYINSGNALFPEMLKAELQEVRSVIEAYSKKAVLEGYEEASACGLRLQYGSNWDSTIRVVSDTGTSVYKLDRWD